MFELRPGKTTLKHKPTGRRFVVDTLTPTGAGLSGIMGGRRIVSREALNNHEVWEITHR